MPIIRFHHEKVTMHRDPPKTKKLNVTKIK